MSPKRDIKTQNRFLWRLSYFFVNFSRKFVGEERLLCVLLDLSWLFRRLAFEQSCKIVGESNLLERTALSRSQFEQKVKPGSRILDVGCGSGRWVEIGLMHGAVIVGIDSNQVAINSCRERFPDATFFNGTLDDYLAANPESRFDYVLLSHLLEHIDKPEEFLRKVAVISRNVLIEVPDFDSDPLNSLRIQYSRPFYTDNDHIFEFNSEELHSLLDIASIEVVSTIKQGGMLFVHGKCQ